MDRHAHGKQRQPLERTREGMTVENSQIAALVAEQRGTVRRIVALESIATAARLGRKRPEAIEQLQTEILALRARVRSLDQAIKQSADAA
jgi:hypothetical protein